MDTIFEVLEDILDQHAVDSHFDGYDVERMLEEAGFMIVPIEDPTNLRFGVDD